MGSTVYPTPSSGKTVKGQAFTSNGNWTAPTGVNYVTVYALGGGGASGGSGSGSNGDNYNGSNSGGDTTFGTNLVIARGGLVGSNGIPNSGSAYSGGQTATANSGQGGNYGGTNQPANHGALGNFASRSGTSVTATVAVTPGSNYSIAIGAGGNIGSYPPNGIAAVSAGAGGSGYLSLTWQE